MTDLRARLARSYTAFFGRFDGLREVQRRALPAVLDGGDVLIASATASGKTEAFAAPAAELALTADNAPLSVLILSPTRALANDLKRRLEGPMQQAGVTFGRHTGEHKERIAGRMPAIVVATPEALDSLLARRPDSLANVRMVVIDEVHVLDGTPRGDQLRVLLHRVERAARVAPNRIAVSATMDDPGAFAARYLKDAKLVVVAGRRSIRGKRFDGKGLRQMVEHLDFLAASGATKLLVFCRGRNQVETYAAKLRSRTRFAEAVFAHHGSMSRAARERTERNFLTAPAGVCFATLTLEMGIDIGTVDYVLLVGAPADVSSLLQRIGRGGRRGATTRFGYVVDSPSEAHVVHTMASLGAQGRLCASPYAFRPSVLVQQALTLAGEHHLESTDLLAATPRDLWPDPDPTWAAELLDHLTDRGHFERHGANRYVLTEGIEQRFTNGTLHSNIDDTAATEVVDRLTGDLIGTVDAADTNRMNLGGSARRIAATASGRILTDATPSADAARFRPRSSPDTSFPLARAVVEALGVPPDALATVTIAGRTYLLHGLGSIGARLLADLLTRSNCPVDPASIGPFTLQTARCPEALPTISADHADRFLTQHFATLEPQTSPGPWSSATPLAWRERSVRTALGLDALSEFLSGAQLIQLDPESVEPSILADL